MPKNRAARRREAREARKDSSIRPSTGLVPITKVNPDHYIVKLVREVIESYESMREASQELQQQGIVLYLDKFQFHPRVPLGFRLFFSDRLRSSLEELEPVKGRNVVLFAGSTNTPQEAMELVKRFAAER